MRMVIAYTDRGRLGRDLGSRWSPKPASEVRFLGLPRRSGPLSLGYPSVKRPNNTNSPAKSFVQGGPGPSRPHKPVTVGSTPTPATYRVAPRPLASCPVRPRLPVVAGSCRTRGGSFRG